MAVITRFIVVRKGVELDKVFDVKKEAEAYDKMLDAAENLNDRCGCRSCASDRNEQD